MRLELSLTLESERVKTGIHLALLSRLQSQAVINKQAPLSPSNYSLFSLFSSNNWEDWIGSACDETHTEPLQPSLPLLSCATFSLDASSTKDCDTALHRSLSQLIKSQEQNATTRNARFPKRKHLPCKLSPADSKLHAVTSQ